MVGTIRIQSSVLFVERLNDDAGLVVDCAQSSNKNDGIEPVL